jgi:fumarylpyruvate hydrolase
MTSDTFVVAAPARTSLPVRGTAARFPVRRVYCIGRNYLAHIREMGEADERDPPIFFQKPADAVQGEGAVLSYPQATEDFQYEAELVVAMGLEGADIAVEAASAHVFGYAVGLDMTRRDLERAMGERQVFRLVGTVQ